MRRNLSGIYVPDFNRIIPGPGTPLPAASPAAPMPPQGPGNGLGRNMTPAEAVGADIARRLQPPALVARSRNAGGTAAGEVNAAGQMNVTQAPWVEKSAGSQPFTEMNQAAVTLPAVGAEATVILFQVPRRRNGVIEFIANQFVGGGWTEGTGDLVWRVEADGVPIQGYHNLIGSIGAIANPGWLGNSPIAVYENQRIALVVRNVAVPVAGQPLLGLFRGRFYPLEQEGQNTWL